MHKKCDSCAVLSSFKFNTDMNRVNLFCMLRSCYTLSRVCLETMLRNKIERIITLLSEIGRVCFTRYWHNLDADRRERMRDLTDKHDTAVWDSKCKVYEREQVTVWDSKCKVYEREQVTVWDSKCKVYEREQVISSRQLIGGIRNLRLSDLVFLEREREEERERDIMWDMHLLLIITKTKYQSVWC